MKARSAVIGSGVTAAAAVLGNVFVGKEALSWFRGLRAPRFQLPMPGFVSIAAGDTAGAVDALNKSLAIQPNNNQLRNLLQRIKPGS